LYFLIGLNVTQNFTIQVEDRNDAPSGIKCFGFTSNGALETPEDSKAGSVLGYCRAYDEDTFQTHSFKITSILATGYNKTW